MNEITNKTLFKTMIIIGVIIALMIIPLYGSRNLFRINSLGATAYTNYSDNNSIIPLRKRSGTYIPNLDTNYSVAPYKYSNTQTTTSYTTPSTTNSYYYTSYEEDTSYQYTDNYGYTPAGCESGTDYSLTTGEPCG